MCLLWYPARKTWCLAHSFLCSCTWGSWHNWREGTNICGDIFCGLQLNADPCSLSQPHKNHFKLPPVSSMPWLAVLPTTFYRWLKSEFTREQWPSDQQLFDFLTSLSQGLYVSQAFLSVLVGGETPTSGEGCSLHLYPVPISSCWSVAFSLL